MRPFSNGTQYMDWELFNCGSCQREQCEIADALELACFDDGEVSAEIAARMGYSDPRAYNWRCGEHDPPLGSDAYREKVERNGQRRLTDEVTNA